MKKGKPPLRNYELPKTPEQRNDPKKEYDHPDNVPPCAGDARGEYAHKSPHRMGKDFVNVAHMIYDYKTKEGGSKTEREMLKQKIKEAVFNREVDFDTRQVSAIPQGGTKVSSFSAAVRNALHQVIALITPPS